MNIKQIQQNVVLVSLDFHQFGNHKLQPKEKYNVINAIIAGGNPKKAERFSVSKQLLDSPELRKINNYFSKVKSWLLVRSIASFRRAVYVLPVEMLDNVDTRMAEYKSDFDATCLQPLVNKYDDLVEESRQVLGDDFDENDYPSKEEVQKRFSMDYSYLTISVPEALPSSIRNREVKKFEETWTDTINDGVKSARMDFAFLINRIGNILMKMERGERTRVTDALKRDFTEFVDIFPKKNKVLEDNVLTNLVDKSRDILNMDIETMRLMVKERQQTIEQIQVIQDELKKVNVDLNEREIMI